MINLNSINLSNINLGEIYPSEIKLGYPSLVYRQPIYGIDGILGLYSGKGLTNEQMAKTPVWKDKSGMGNDLQMKNFLWGLSSGCGMYSINMPAELSINQPFGTLHFTISTKYAYSVLPSSTNSINIKFKVRGLLESLGKGLYIRSTNASGTLDVKVYHRDGIYEYNYNNQEGISNVSLYNGEGGIVNFSDFYIEIIPDYQGAICFDGVNDFGVCETFPILTKEKGYTVMALREWLSEKDSQCLVSNRLNSLEDNAFNFELRNINQTLTRSFSNYNTDKVNYPTGPVSWQTSTSYNGTINLNSNYYKGNNCLNVCAMDKRSLFANAAIYSLVIIDHDTTPEERQLVIDYWKKEFPELFPDQAWTVTGKTNESADRATIKNLTGNGNDLVLSNVAFAGNSGYGEYVQDFQYIYANIAQNWTILSAYNKTKFTSKTSFTNAWEVPIGGEITYYSLDKYVNKQFRFIFNSNVSNVIAQARWYDIGSNLIKTVDLIPGKIVECPQFTETLSERPLSIAIKSMNIDDWFSLEQIPDFDGYLVTDGVEDKVNSTTPYMLSEKYSIVGDWKLLDLQDKLAGVSYPNRFYIYPSVAGMKVYINSTSNPSFLIGIKSLKAITSDGVGYDDNWNQIPLSVGITGELVSSLLIGYRASNWARVAFKNLGIHNGRILTKEQLIKAYNCLQTLKNT